MRALAWLALAAVACSSPAAPGPEGEAGAANAGGSSSGAGGSSGYGAGPAHLEVVAMAYTPTDLPVVLLEEGDQVELWRAPQGGHVMRIAARVKGLDSDIIELRARLRHPESGAIIAEESRTVVMELVEGEPGWMQTDRRSGSQSAHVPACPSYGDHDIDGGAYLLQVEVTELYADFSFGTAELMIVPTCMQTDASELALCQCECTSGYTLGKCG